MFSRCNYCEHLIEWGDVVIDGEYKGVAPLCEHFDTEVKTYMEDHILKCNIKGCTGFKLVGENIGLIEGD